MYGTLAHTLLLSLCCLASGKASENMGRKSKWNVDNIQEFLDSTGSGCTLVTKEIRYLKDKLEFKCKCGNHFHRNFHNVVNQKSYYCEDCSKQIISNNKKLSHEDYLKRLTDNNITNIIPLEKYVTAKTNILHRCLTCNYEWSVRPDNILSGYGCPVCNGGHCVPYKTDIATLSPELIPLLKDKEDAHRYAPNSNKSIDFICPNCGRDIHTSPALVRERGLPCRTCNDGISIPNKFMEQILIQAKIEYNTECIFDWSENRRYDFYIPSHKAIIEVMGKQHYDEDTFTYVGGRTLEEEQINDDVKEELALTNGIVNYFRLDFRYSDYEYMKNSFLNSNIPKCFNINIDEINFDICYQNTLKSKMIQAIDLWNKGMKTEDISKVLKVSITTTIRYLRNGTDINLCDYNGLNKKVICVTTNEIFPSIKLANETYNTNKVGNCCRGERNFAGEKDGIKLKWMFYKDYIESIAS